MRMQQLQVRDFYFFCQRIQHPPPRPSHRLPCFLTYDRATSVDAAPDLQSASAGPSRSLRGRGKKKARTVTPEGEAIGADASGRSGTTDPDTADTADTAETPPPASTFACSKCDKIFKSAGGLEYHTKKLVSSRDHLTGLFHPSLGPRLHFHSSVPTCTVHIAWSAKGCTPRDVSGYNAGQSCDSRSQDPHPLCAEMQR